MPMMACPGCGNPLNPSQGSDDVYCCDSGDYRYFLRVPTRLKGDGTCLFLMLNPGTKKGQEERNHKTRDKCRDFATKWGYSTLWTCNQFAIGGTSPTQVLGNAEPVGSDNDRHIRRAVRLADKVVLAWGCVRHPKKVHRPRIQKVLHMLDEVEGSAGKLYVLDPQARASLTWDHQPRHPLPRGNSLLVDTTECRRVVPEHVNGSWRLRVYD